MARITANISMSVDGFITGPNVDVDTPLGEHGERLHEWMTGLASWREHHGLEGGERNRDAELVKEAFAGTGAVLMGRRMFEHGERPWGVEPPFHMPVFVITHRARDVLVKPGGTSFTFVTDGVESAVARAREAAGGKDVLVAGGASVIQQVIRAGLLEELEIHLVPVLLGGGTRLFDRMGDATIELDGTRVIESPTITHLRFRLPTR